MRLAYSAWVAILLSSVAVPQALNEVPARPVTAGEDQAQSADELVKAGGKLLDLQHYDEAIAVFTRAIELDGHHGHAFANRALGYGHTNRLEEARRDLAAAEALIPAHAVIYRIRALIALRQSDKATALAELSASLEKEPGNPFALWHRAWLYHDSRNEAAALADAEAYIGARPNDPDGYVLMADLLRAQQKTASAEMEADRLLRLFPDNHYAIASAARIYDGLGDRSRALHAITDAISIQPKLFYYHMLRAGFRPSDDLAGRRTDLNAALEIDPANADVLTKLGLLEFDEQQWAQAISRFSAVLSKEPKDFGVLAYRSMAYWNSGNKSQAGKDYQAALAAASGADDFNLICRSLARENVALDWALQACDRALAVKPEESRYLATRALARLRLGKLNAALADYDAAINADERRADALLGRAIVRWRLGNKTSAEADRIAAMARDAGILESFRELGFTDF